MCLRIFLFPVPAVEVGVAGYPGAAGTGKRKILRHID
jgi:hypothetical protein